MSRLTVALAVLVGFVGVVEAHPLDIGYLRLEARGETVDVALDLNREASALLIKVPAVDDEVLKTRTADLARATYLREPISTPNGPCTWGTPVARIENEGKSVRINDRATCPAGEKKWTFPFVRDSTISATFELLVKETIGGEQRVQLVDRYEPTYVFGTAEYSFLDFVWSGVEHIGVAPSQWRDADGDLQLPDGIDHILFLVALLLGGGKVLRLVGIATGFTVGHSITLALATLDILRPPAEIIEPIIALSIALAAAEAFTGRFEKHRWKIATGFGFIHGFGFAGALVELQLSSGDMAKALFGYNFGVELGQVALVIVVAPLVILAHRNEIAKKYVLRAIAAGIFVAGMYWFVQRLMG